MLKNTLIKKNDGTIIKKKHDMSSVATIILGGGQGTRLFPLTSLDCKPAITFGGKYRLIDVPISNALHSGCHKIFVVTQFLSKSLHEHLYKTYNSGSFSPHSFIDVLSVEEKPHGKVWFQGTADAIRQNIDYLMEVSADYYLILSGDQLYQMDYQKMMDVALKTDADLVIGTLPVVEKEAARLGILKTDKQFRITDFIEKPQDPKLLKPYKLSSTSQKKLNVSEDKEYLASMGIYLFKRKSLLNLLLRDMRDDFGKHLIPNIVNSGNVVAFIHDGYWEDIGTIESYYNANMNLVVSHNHFDWYDEKLPIMSKSLNLPPPKIFNTQINESIICEGSYIKAKEISKSIIGPRSIIEEDSIIRNSYISGHNFYYAPVPDHKIPQNLGIGKNCLIEKAIIDKHSSIGNNVTLINKNKVDHYDSELVYIRNGIIVVPRGVTLPDGFSI